jgi:hypothetical protein
MLLVGGVGLLLGCGTRDGGLPPVFVAMTFVVVATAVATVAATVATVAAVVDVVGVVNGVDGFGSILTARIRGHSARYQHGGGPPDTSRIGTHSTVLYSITSTGVAVAAVAIKAATTNDA